jgi:hypothetical protein
VKIAPNVHHLNSHAHKHRAAHVGRFGCTMASRARIRNGLRAGSMLARASSHVSATVSGHGGQGTSSMTMA